MSQNVQGKRQRGDSWEYTIKKAGVLDKPLYLTFKNEQEGDDYVRKLRAQLDRGIVPTEYQVEVTIKTIGQIVGRHLQEVNVSHKDRKILEAMSRDDNMGLVPMLSINANWVDEWVTKMKREENLAPATIRSKVGALARCCDWGMRKGLVLMPDHPLRTLRDGYAQYTKTDEDLAGKKKEDVERDRRLEAGELDKILAMVDGGVLPRKQRPLKLEFVPALRCIIVLAVESAMRMREMYTLTVDQVDLARRTIFLDKTKNGDKRQVPLSSVAVATLKTYLEVRALPEGRPENLLFPWWDGMHDEDHMHKLSNEMSKHFKSIFIASGCAGLHFHDLRHEATSRLFERTSLSETEIMKITGHKTHRMMMRYANLRASDLAAKLW